MMKCVILLCKRYVFALLVWHVYIFLENLSLITFLRNVLNVRIFCCDESVLSLITVKEIFAKITISGADDY